MIYHRNILLLCTCFPSIGIICVYGFGSNNNNFQTRSNIINDSKARNSMYMSISDSNDSVPQKSVLQRREVLLKSTKAIVGGATTALFPSFSSQGAVTEAVPFLPSKSEPPRFTAYHVKPDASAELSPKLSAVSGGELLKIASLVNKNGDVGGGAVWLGEHHNSLNDHTLQASIIANIYNTRRKMGDDTIVIGLEMVQIKFQPVLDAYIFKGLSEKEMLEEVQWETRWTWPFAAYRPIFETARELGIRILALNVNSEDLALVESGGFPALGKEKLNFYIRDPQGFAAFAASEAFKEYVSYVIAPSYRMHQQMGILKGNMSFERFLSGRLLWDESMAGIAAQWCKQNPKGILLGCVGLDHVKFLNGIPARFERMSSSQSSNISLLLNPTLTDSRPPGTVSSVANTAAADRITLQLRYDDGAQRSGVLPLADYLVLSGFS